jgi:hypothetical protein
MRIKWFRDRIVGNGVLEFTRMMQDRPLVIGTSKRASSATAADSDPRRLLYALPFLSRTSESALVCFR